MFSNGFCKIPGAINVAKKVDIAPAHEPMSHDFAVAAFKVMLPTEGGEHFSEI